jgi:hypothetical protein
MAATEESAKQALLDKIEALAKSTNRADHVLDLAEAWAWVVAPFQPHGGSSTPKS